MGFPLLIQPFNLDPNSKLLHACGFIACKHEFLNEWKVRDAVGIGFWYKTAELCLRFLQYSPSEHPLAVASAAGCCCLLMLFPVLRFQTLVSDP
jgi:hypothetical protein